MPNNLVEIIVSILAVAVAGLSLWYTNKGLSDQRRHNRLTVKPIPFVACADYEDLIRVKVRNDGTGPMIVRDISARKPGCEPEFNDLVSYMPELPSGMAWSNFSSGYVRSIPVGSELILVELKLDHAQSAQAAFRDLCRASLSQLEISVEYTDVYGSKFENEVRFLDFFARRLASSKAN